MKDNPLVSVVTPVRNGEAYLVVCLESVLGQTYRNIEHVVVDGGSTDGTLRILADYAARYPGRLRYVSGPDDGVGDALNKGFAMAKGDILGWLDADDLYEEDAVMAAVKYFNEHTDAYYVYGGSKIIDGRGEVIGSVSIVEHGFREVVRGSQYISLCSAFHRREVFHTVGLFNSVGNNFDYWLRIAKLYRMHFLDRELMRWRVGADSVGFSRDSRKVRMIGEKLRQDAQLCRQNGGGILAPRCMKYRLFVIMTRTGLYHPVNVLLRARMRDNPIVKRLLRSLGV